MSQPNLKGPDTVSRALLPGSSNRLILSLLSGVPADVDWALRDLLKYSAHNTDRFTLASWTHAMDALLAWPQQLLELAQEQSRWGEAGWELRGPAGEATQRRGSESLLILRNASFNEKANGRVLGSSSRLIAFIEAFLALPADLLLDHLAEPTLLALDIFADLVASSAFTLRPESTIPASLVPLFRTRDRAVLLAVSRLTLALTSPSYAKPATLAPNHALVAPALASAVKLLLLPRTSQTDRALRTAALDLLYQHTMDPAAAARNVLGRTDVGPVVRLVAQGLYDDALRFDQPVALHPRDRIGIVDVHLRPLVSAHANLDDWLPSPPELDELAMAAEPDRCTRWITRSFKRDPHGKITQTNFWSAYRTAFTDRVGHFGGPPLMNASEVIKIVSEIVPGAIASVEPHPSEPGTKVFLIKGIHERKPFPTEPEPNPLLLSSVPAVRARLAAQSHLPEGTALTCALILRNLARAVVDLLDLHADGADDDGAGDVGAEGGDDEGGSADAARQGRRKKARLQNGEMFGLPIPESLKYAGQGQGTAPGGSTDGTGAAAGDAAAAPAALTDGDALAGEVRLGPAEAARVRNAFAGVVEQTVLEWVTEDEQLAPYLTDVLECIGLLSATTPSRP